MVSVKLEFIQVGKREVRRFKVLNYEDLILKIESFSGIKKDEILSKEYRLEYLDDENDWIQFDSAEEYELIETISTEPVKMRVTQKIAKNQKQKRNFCPPKQKPKSERCQENAFGGVNNFFKNFFPQCGGSGSGSGMKSNDMFGGMGGMGGMFQKYAQNPQCQNMVKGLFQNPQCQSFVKNMFQNYCGGGGFGGCGMKQKQPKGGGGGCPFFGGKQRCGKGNFLKKMPGFHHGVICDGCGKKNWAGMRFKCVECKKDGGYDLCGMCMKKNKCEKFHLHQFRVVHPSAKNGFEFGFGPFEGNAFVVDPKKEGKKEEKKEEKKDEKENEEAEGEGEEKVVLSEKEDEVLYPSVPEYENMMKDDKEKEEEFGEEIKVLNQMGFSDEKLNTLLLKLHKGNVKKVIELLVQM